MKDSILNKIIYLINGVIAYVIYALIWRKKNNNKYWVIGGHLGQIYDDNSKAFFEYMIENTDKDIYWVLNKNSIAETQIKFKEKVLYRGSIRSYLYCYQAECIIVSHCLADVIPIFYKMKSKFRFFSIYLEHGILGFKKVYSDENYYSQFDIICTVSQFEKKIKKDNFKVDESKLKLTGLTRYDSLKIGHRGNGNILLMLTWREYKDNTEYVSKVISLLTNDKLQKMLKIKKIYMNVVLHSFMHKYYEEINKVKSDNIIILPKESNIQEQLISNSLLITDYSSVSWDFAYMKKPVIFYQFDLERYLSVRGSYINLRDELFGAKVTSEEELIELIEEYIDDNEIRLNRNMKKIDEYFENIDNNNCKRLLDEINKLVKVNYE